MLGFEQVGVIMGQWFVGTRRASPQDKRLTDFNQHLVVERLNMHGLQPQEELAGTERIERRIGQPTTQCLEQPGSLLEQTPARFGVFTQADAPDQFIHGAQRRLPLQRLFTVLENGH